MSALGARPALGVRRLPVQADPTPGELDEELASVFADIVADGSVRWTVAATAPYRARIEALYAAFAEQGPNSTPERFPNRNSRLAFAINAYNLLVIVAVLRHWPITGVGEVRGLIEPKPFFGFFYGLRLRLDGRWVHLYGHERRMFVQWPDSRIHAAINCASASCPPLIARPFAEATLDQQLDAACQDWLRRDGVVIEDVSSRVITLPPLLGLYPGNFGAAASTHGWGDSDLDWVLHWLGPSRSAALRARVGEGWSINIPSYDWALSGA